MDPFVRTFRWVRYIKAVLIARFLVASIESMRSSLHAADGGSTPRPNTPGRTEVSHLSGILNLSERIVMTLTCNSHLYHLRPCLSWTRSTSDRHRSLELRHTHDLDLLENQPTHKRGTNAWDSDLSPWKVDSKKTCGSLSYRWHGQCWPAEVIGGTLALYVSPSAEQLWVTGVVDIILPWFHFEFITCL